MPVTIGKRRKDIHYDQCFVLKNMCRFKVAEWIMSPELLLSVRRGQNNDVLVMFKYSSARWYVCSLLVINHVFCQYCVEMKICFEN